MQHFSLSQSLFHFIAVFCILYVITVFYILHMVSIHKVTYWLKYTACFLGNISCNAISHRKQISEITSKTAGP